MHRPIPFSQAAQRQRELRAMRRIAQQADQVSDRDPFSPWAFTLGLIALACLVAAATLLNP